MGISIADINIVSHSVQKGFYIIRNLFAKVARFVVENEEVSPFSIHIYVIIFEHAV